MFSATDAAFEGFRLARRHPFLMLFWAIAYTVAILVLVLMMFAAIMPELLPALLKGPGALQSLPDNHDFNVVGFAIALPVLFVAVLVLTAMTITAIYRAVLRPKERGFGYLAIGGDEGRQILLMLLVCGVSILAVGGAVALVAGAVAVTPQAWKALVGVAGGIACALLLIWASVRLSLASAQTFAERRVTLFDSWALTRGRFWPLLGMWLLSAVLAIIVSLVVSGLSYLPLLLAPGGLQGLDHNGWPDITRASMSTALIVAFVAQGVLQMIGAILQVVVQTVPGAAAYAQLKPAA